MTANSNSYLVRFWQEPRADETRAPVVRGMVRNLRTGGEQLVLGPDELAEFMRQELSQERQSAPVAATRSSSRRSAGGGRT